MNEELLPAERKVLATLYGPADHDQMPTARAAVPLQPIESRNRRQLTMEPEHEDSRTPDLTLEKQRHLLVDRGEGRGGGGVHQKIVYSTPARSELRSELAWAPGCRKRSEV